MVELPFRQLFRAASWAFVGILYGTAIRVAWLVRLGASEITETTLSTVPDSLAALLLGPEKAASVSYIALSTVNLGEIIWIGVLAYCLVRTGRVGRAAAAGLVLVAWMLLATLQVGVVGYMAWVS